MYELNKGVVVYVLSDWMGKEMGRYSTLDAAEERIDEITRTDKEVRALNHRIDHLADMGNKEHEIEQLELLLEELTDGIREDLYIMGLDNNGNDIIVEFG